MWILQIADCTVECKRNGTLFLVKRGFGWQLWMFSWRGDRYASVTLRYAVSDQSRLSSLPLLENKSRAANLISASLKKGCSFFCTWYVLLTPVSTYAVTFSEHSIVKITWGFEWLPARSTNSFSYSWRRGTQISRRFDISCVVEDIRWRFHSKKKNNVFCFGFEGKTRE